MQTQPQPLTRAQRQLRIAKNVLVVIAVAWSAGYLVLAWAIFKRPILGVVVAAYVGLVVWIGWHDAEGLVLWALIIMALWRWLHRRSFERLVAWRLRRAWRRLYVYERGWRATMILSGLSKRYGPRTVIPKLRELHSSEWGDRVLIGLVAGQCTEDVERVAPELAHSFGARACRVREERPGMLWLEFATGDPLVQIVPAVAIPDKVDLRAVTVGVQEDGQPWQLRVLGTHLLIAGATGSGKGSVLWSLLRGLAPAICDGWVVVWAIDPKGGMELAPGRALFARFCGDEFEAMADLLDDAVTVMRDRARRLAGVTRLHEPTVAEPLIVVVVDEVATLSAYLPDRKLRERMAHALGLLLTQGRAVGVSVVAALQDPRKEVLAYRNLFPARVGLRLDEASQIDMVLGAGAREQGAGCDRIPMSLPGVGYVRLDGVREPTRVRAGYVTDEDIAAMATDYGPHTTSGARPRSWGEQLFEGEERAS